MNTEKYYEMEKTISHLYPTGTSTTKDRNNYLSMKKTYKEELRKIEERFKQDAFEELDLQNHPKKEVLYRYAYDRGHSGGYGDIFSELEDIVLLLKELNK